MLQRLRSEALCTGIPSQRLQQRVAFERLLARLPRDGEWVLKGGFASQLRYGLQARPTRDVDLRTPLAPADALDRLRRATTEVTLTDHFDLSSEDALVDPPDILQFAGVAPVEFPAYPVPQHLAEKLHAYTLPRGQENTRVKDLVDLVVMAATEPVEANRLSRSVNATFAVRRTHAVPDRLPEPPISWRQSFATVANEAVNTSAINLQEGYVLAAQFWDPFLAHGAILQTWLPSQRQWSNEPVGLSES